MYIHLVAHGDNDEEVTVETIQPDLDQLLFYCVKLCTALTGLAVLGWC